MFPKRKLGASGWDDGVRRKAEQMDAPVIFDNAGAFGRSLDLDRELPGHPQQSSQGRAQAQPQPQQQQPQQQQREKSPAPAQKPQAQSQGNVRHIPIFVEGRDEPVIAKDVDEPDFPRRQQSPPQFQRPPPTQPHFEDNLDDWFGDRFNVFSQPRPSPFFQSRQGHEKPRTQQTHFPESHQQSPRQKPQAQHPRQQQSHPQQHPHQQPQQQQKQQQHQQQKSQQQQQPQNEAQPEVPSKPRQQVQPKDPLEKVALVQKEVDALTEQVRQYEGNSRKDKQYIYLDEMLTRELIKLDDIETEGKDNVRQARKQAIKSIQESISLLESKAPLPGQQPEPQKQPDEQPAAEAAATEQQPMESSPAEEKPAESTEAKEVASA